ncbi:hypothetical protein BDY19DRAFT_1077256 [Irpex rosettiformis]|uniref:Uncharacterized protein n=1 Tax=Irpex rosettiformis TaxID=378272 RepID=A0ACB8TS28_9APHY|nr:hypothetical protein BDY19DRAFT_1077256 [Irpex rosettiformis]
MDEVAALEALANNLSLITENPYDLSLHIQNVRLERETGMEDQEEAVLDMLVTYWAAGEQVWMPLIDLRVKNSNLESPEGLQSVLELFEKAEADYLSIPILKRHLEFLLERFNHFQELDARPKDLEDMFTQEWTRPRIENVVAQGIAHLTQSYVLWDLKKDWELERLEEATADEKKALAQNIETMFLERLRQPHSNHDETFQAYSSFTTNYKPADQYETLLVQASKLRAQAVKAYQKRESYESSLTQADYSLEGYAYYLEFEKRGKKLDLFLLPALYERAIAEADRRRFADEPNAGTALVIFWIGYLDFIRTHNFEDNIRYEIYKRATRSVPSSGEVWARYIRFLERLGHADEVNAAYSSALSVKPLTLDSDQLVPVVFAKASFERRKVEREEIDNEGYEGVLLPLLEAQSLIREKIKTGDPRLRLEKYFSSICLDAANLPEEAINMWSATVRHYKTSYMAWIAYTDALIRLGMYDQARNVFREIAPKNLDWPEAVWEAWTAFEQVHGSVEELEDCFDRIERAQKQVNAKRAKDAEKAALQAAQFITEQQGGVPLAEASAQGDAQMEVDHALSEGSSKRKAEDEVPAEGSKKARIDQVPSSLKRDRENCTVFVANLPSNTSEEDLRLLFKDCGPIREVKITSLSNSLVATVEFMERDSVPAALTKDKKRIHDEEVVVHLAWQSTLYVTNFPESADDEFIRTLFGKYGVLFDVRWPSKKFKNSRRFCYVQFASPNSAKAALELHSTEIEPGLPLSVLISNPERKKDRTDSDANDREIYVAGLARSVTKQDLEKLFSTYGTVKEVRLVLDDKGQTRGFAFVEFQQEKDALASLSANNHELKKRRIAVTLADTRVKAAKNHPSGKRSAEVRNRSIRVRGLPAGTQEGLLQQILSKHAQVQRVEVFQDSHEAIAEMENPAEAGKLLLLSAPIVFNGQTLQLSEESLESAPPTHRATASRPLPGAPTGLFVPRTAASRPRAGLGSKRARATVSAAPGTNTTFTAASSTATTSTAKGQDDFRKMLGGA